MNKEFERCCTFLAEMMEKYGLEILRDLNDPPQNPSCQIHCT